jgi:hypothetical protein
MIRSLTLSLVLCCLTAWVASVWVTAILVHYVAVGGGATAQNGFLAIRTGQISFLREGPLLSANWQAGLTGNTFTSWWVPGCLNEYYAASTVRFLGFYFRNGSSLFVSIPLWFPTIVTGLLLWWAWRSTRGHAATGAFPVENSARIPATPPEP